MPLISATRYHAFWLFLAYLIFVIYGSLLPFEYREHSLDEAIKLFTNIGYLDLGLTSRADWIANIVLYIPLAFLCCTWLLGMRTRSFWNYLVLLPVFVICLSIAVAVEFTQIFFAPRTVSLNDLLAETLGILGGISLWAFGRWRILQLRDSFASGGRESVLAAGITYGLAYLTLSLFPYDFLISSQELAWKLQHGHQGWLIAGGCSNLVRCSARLAGDVLAIAPLGLLIRLAFPRLELKRLFLAGIAFGMILEGLQFLLASGTSQGLSVILRGIGLAGGAVIGEYMQRMGTRPLARFIWRATPFIALPYILFLAALAGWLTGTWLSPGEALARLSDVRLAPFFYHYYTSEPKAMASLLANAAMYAPIGGLVWARRAARAGTANRDVSTSALWAVCLALPMELGKLLIVSKHPDFTNLLIAAAAAAFTNMLATWVEQVLTGVKTNKPAPAVSQVMPEPSRPASSRTKLHPVGIIIAFPTALLTLTGLLYYPTATVLLSIALLIYGILLWRKSLIWFFVLPALLPSLDFSPFTGRLLLDEFDLFVLVTLMMSYPRAFRTSPMAWPNHFFPVAIFLLWTTWIIASTRGLWPLLDTSIEFLPSSHSPLEAWHVGKGLLWALLLAPLILRVPAEDRQTALGYAFKGLTAGLSLVVLVVLWERHVHVGLLDFENVFRVTGPFASMQTGGAYIEAFIAFAFPVLAVWTLLQQRWSLRLFGIAAVILASYAMLVTFSRGGYAGLMAGLLVLAFGTVRSRRGRAKQRWLAIAGLVTGVIVIAAPILSGGFAKDRLSRTLDDLEFRLSHWSRAVDLMDDGLFSALTGNGYGQYPTHYLLKANYPQPPGTYSVLAEDDNLYLRLGAGEAVYLDQIVAIEPDARYSLSASIRHHGGDKSLEIPVCEKALLYSFACIWERFDPEPANDEWTGSAIEFKSGDLGNGGHWPHRPVKLSLFNPGNHVIDVDDISLKTPKGVELLRNGDFSDGIKHWLFVTDQDIAWHIHQQWMEMYFAQGFLGITAFVVLLIAVTVTLWPLVLSGNLQATALTAAMAGFLIVGLMGSTMDTARLSMLFYLGAFFSGLLFSAPVKHENRLVEL